MMESMNESFVNSSVVGRHKDITPEQKDKWVGKSLGLNWLCLKPLVFSSRMAELVASGKSQTEVARMFGICQPTVSRILKSRNARFGIIAPIQQHQRKRQKSLFPRKAVTSVGHQLYTWYTAQKNQGWVVDDQMLLERARELYKLVDPNGREPDQSWLDNWNRCFLASANTNGFNKCKLKSYLLCKFKKLMRVASHIDNSILF